jgi:hypothetical protein
VVQQEGKPNRHIYDLTERGIALLHASPCDFPPEQAANEIERVNEFARLAYEAQWCSDVSPHSQRARHEQVLHREAGTWLQHALAHVHGTNAL